MVWQRVNGAGGFLRAATALTVAGAGLGASLIGSGGTAFADSSESGVIGVSPAREVVQFAPNAVSVTFSTPLRKSGASMRIMTKEGDVGDGAVSTGSRTLHRDLVIGSPNGFYTVNWSAVAQDGQKLSGTFSFTAGHPNNDPLITGESAPEVTASATAQPTAQPGPGASASSAATDPEPSETPPVPDGSVTKDPWANDGDVLAVAASDGDEPPSRGGASYGFPLLAMALGALLVIASGLVSRRHRASVPDRLTIHTRSGIYSV
jgi:methionine-rich copper-binding protein CopC